ncbi:hypothetical protein HNQ80_005235 [Anaerosolibacter carboniphilus]|uniref:IS4 family transposase n=1 Tax=Anaerosolibacter carboniphilus TaxID=1417629 RepID=A0A841KZL2_9FIRM|nr:IS4 family transposase [Anaerosolibacter carboniphilus]MBB6219054.1 hypothetical protein [Anaerosolibacter carboniphilus]
MTQLNNKTVLRKITQVFYGSYFNKIVDKYDGDYKTQHFYTRSHAIAMIYQQFSGTDSLRLLSCKAIHSSKIKQLMGAPSFSQLSRKNANRSSKIFEEMYYHLVDVAKAKLGLKIWNQQFNNIKIIDGTIVQIAASLAPKLEYKNGKAGIKVTTLYDFNRSIPAKINITPAKTNDRKCLEELFDDPQALYLFDKGYFKYKLYDKLTREGRRFITRQINNAHTKIVEEYETCSETLKDRKIWLGKSDKRAENQYREIIFYDEKNEEFKILTNDFVTPAEQVVELYKLRWSIEIFFKWIKQNLKIKKWLGYNENAIKIQIYSALIAYILLRLLHLELSPKISITLLRGLLQMNLLEHEDTITILSG